MTTKYFALLTNQGAAKLANAAALGTKVDITSMAVGDGGGTLPTPDPAQTKLIGEKRRAQLNSLTIDAANGSQIIAEQIIPESEGGFWIREIGLYDADGVLIAVANCPETYKPQLQEGSGRTQTVRMILIVNSTSAVTLKIDPAVVLATRKYVDDSLIVAKQYADTLQERSGKYTDDQMALHLKAADPHGQYLKVLSLLSEIKDSGKAQEALENLGVKVQVGPTFMSVRIGNLILIAGNATASTTSEGNLNVIFPFAFPTTVFYLNITQANQTYATDVNPLTFSPYPAPAGPVTALGAAVRNSKTGNYLASTVVASRYLAIGY